MATRSRAKRAAAVQQNEYHKGPRIVTLTEEGSVKTIPFPYNVEQFYISCIEEDKLLYLEFLLSHLRKALIFTSSNDVSCRVKACLGKVGLKGEVLKADLDASYEQQLFEDLDAGRLRFLIAADDNQSTVDYYRKGKGHKRGSECLDLRFGMIKGIDFKKVHQVINFNMPQSVSGYFRRIVHTGKPDKIGTCYSLVSPSEMGIIQDVKSFLGDDPGEDSKILIYEGRRYERKMIYDGFIDLYGWEALSRLGIQNCDPVQLLLDHVDKTSKKEDA